MVCVILTLLFLKTAEVSQGSHCKQMFIIINTKLVSKQIFQSQELQI